MVEQSHPISGGFAPPMTPIYNGEATYYRSTAIDTTGELTVPASGARRYGAVIVNESTEDGWIAATVTDLADVAKRMVLPGKVGSTYTPVTVIGQGAVAVAASSSTIDVSGYTL